MTEQIEQIPPTPEGREGEPQVRFSLIIPTRNEVGNVNPLFERLSPVLSNYNAEVIFVDDSDDATPNAITEKNWPFPVKVIHREAAERVGGLSTAVLEGVTRANGEYIGVMDADLQHPPEVLPRLLDTATSNNDDIVIASRFVEGGSPGGLSGPIRRLGSEGTIFLSHVLFPELKGVKDPMSGFFLFNRRILEGDVTLNPQGFKILLELLVKSNWFNLDEVPLQFQRREHGESKLDLKETMAIYSHMFRLFREKRSRRTN